MGICFEWVGSFVFDIGNVIVMMRANHGEAGVMCLIVVVMSWEIGGDKWV